MKKEINTRAVIIRAFFIFVVFMLVGGYLAYIGV
ncbi:hypothetical protein EDF67_104266 [Sphingobacterium sp. JUb78]|nr:hypothetical protein [Sphingobacterium sp. JUb21]MCW2260033.1 hypothetical protein [Sphingobacterium kitahiroshimense]TCR08599.1 hypothetical protein EDF66_103146 [Sphingobacterium sp. JUb20]TCR11173.1 hypothetical protein EDF67_104266 [Sphingobacterium sp. JUb78]